MNPSSNSEAAGATTAGFLPASVVFGDDTAGRFIQYTGMMPEGDRLRTLGSVSTFEFALPYIPDRDFLLQFEVAAFVWPNALPRQRVHIRLGDNIIASWLFRDGVVCRRAIVVRREDISVSGSVRLEVQTPDCARPADIGINDDDRLLGLDFIRVTWDLVRDFNRSNVWAGLLGRRVGSEARKSFDDKVISGFWGRFITGPNVLDIGFRGYDDDIVPIVEGAIGVDLDYPGYDGTRLPFDDESQDAVFSSHCLEHIHNHLQVILDWYRVTKIGGYIITVVPNSMLYERKRRPPSRRAGWNHQRFYTPQTLLAEFESVLIPNSYRVRHLAENDANYSYDYDMERHPDGCYEIELVIEKITPPSWHLDE